MDKFPGDVEMAEKLTGGDPDILSTDKFCPQEKPDISAIFGDKKTPKTKRPREEVANRRSDGVPVARKITHPRFLRESDHEIRIRHQPSSLPTTPRTPSADSPQFSCHLCNFTSFRVNVIICHMKSHRSESYGPPIARPRLTMPLQSKSASKTSPAETQKRKYVRKSKSLVPKSKDRDGEPVKRKHTKSADKPSKKKKTDPELREKLLADWDDESDVEMDLETTKTSDSIGSTPIKNSEVALNKSESLNDKDDEAGDGAELIRASEKLLRDTDKFASLLEDASPSRASVNSNNKHTDDSTIEKTVKSLNVKKLNIKRAEEGKKSVTEKDEKSSKFSCFDFDEDDLPEPTITPVRKIPRVFGEKNTSVKKEILKKFTLSQAMKNDKDNEDNEKSTNVQDFIPAKQEAPDKQEIKDIKVSPEKKTNDWKVSLKDDEIVEETKVEVETSSEEQDKNSKNNLTETVEIVEIFEVETEKDETDESSKYLEKIETQIESIIVFEKPAENNDEAMETEKVAESTTPEKQVEAPREICASEKLLDELMSEVVTTETEDETVSELADSDNDTRVVEKPKAVEKIAPRRRGRPRKSFSSASGNGDDTPKLEATSKKIEALVSRDTERKTSESDSDRSYTGRRRKPNKRYLHSDIYARSPDNRASKTDESQSETDEKLPKGRSRRGRKSSHTVLDKVEAVEQNKDQEFEFSNRTLDNAEPPNVSATISKPEIKDEQGKSGALDVKSDIETEGESSLSCTLEHPKKLDCGIGSPINITKLLSFSDSDSKQSQDKEATNEKPPEVVQSLSKEPEIIVNEEAKNTKFDALKPVDKLPPKKSQIKKFELSQIELLDACSEQVAAESAAKNFDYGEESAMEITPIAVSETPIDKPEKIVTEPITPVKENKKDDEKFLTEEVPKNLVSDEIEAGTVSTTTINEEASDQREKNDEASIEKVDRIEASIAKVDTIEASIAKVDTIETSVSKVDTIETSVSKVDTIETSVSKVDAIETKVAKVDAIEAEVAKVDAIETKVAKVDAIEIEVAKVDAIETEVAKVDAIETKVAIVSDVKEVQTPKPNETVEISANPPKPSTPTKSKLKLTPETGAKAKKDKRVEEEEIPVSFQEAFLKHIDKTDEKISEVSPKVKEIPLPEKKIIENSTIVEPQEPQPTLNAMTEFEGVEILMQDANVAQPFTTTATTSQVDLSGLLDEPKPEEASTLSLDLQKIEDSLTDSLSTPSPNSDVNVPVKKREKPRIIENVTLKEPMQILKSKLLEKLPPKTTKHKLETETPKKNESKGSSRAKIMKIDSSSSNSKARSPSKTSHMTTPKKLQMLKAEEAAEKEKAATQSQIGVSSGGEKFIQQSSQSLADMELDINSMPFVLSEDVLTPDNIEQMPVVISSIIPSSTTAMTTSITLTPTTQLASPSQVQYKTTASETVTTETPTVVGKKKSGTPAILKSKAKAKPTITSIKTLVPPLTGGVKSLKFQSTQAGKALPMISQKSTPGKYVIVQTSSGQQMRYSVTGKPGTQQKIAIPTGKGAGSAQIVQQGGKVVILTSAQSGQTKMLPLNITKATSGKVQKIVNNKGQIYTQINAQGVPIGTKTIITSKSFTNSPTTSKLSQGQKIINTQGVITTKGVLTPISTAKTGLMQTFAQSIMTKGGIYTPISSAQLQKTIIGGKTLVSKGATILSPLVSQAMGTSKNVLSPIAGKTIINAQSLVTPKGTVLTPITGQQVKALAAKNPTKGVAKLQYQTVQQNLQLPMLQKCQKIASGSQLRVAASPKSPGGSTVVYQNPVAGQKVMTPTGKKVVRQVLHPAMRSPQSPQASTSPQQLQRSKTVPATPTMQKTGTPRRQTKAQQKIILQKSPETSTSGSSLMNIQAKPTTGLEVAKTPRKSQSTPRGKANRQKNLLNVASSTVTTVIGAIETSGPSLALSQAPPLTPIVCPTETLAAETEKSLNITADTLIKDALKVEAQPTVATTETPKVEENKVPMQPQIMALPTEGSDGTFGTYVLVTIDEQGQIQPLDNNTLMSLEGTTQNPDGSRTLYIDPSSLGEAGALDNIVLQFDNGSLPNIQPTTGSQTVSTESFPSEIIQTSNQDILAAALANTDFQQEIGLPENPVSSVMTTGLTQTSLINQTILQSTIIPPTEPISSPSVLETSLTLNQPIMTPLEVPTSMPIQVATPPSISSIPTSLELPITITNPNISYISAAAAMAAAGASHIQIPGNSMPDIGEIMESSGSVDVSQTETIPVTTQYLVIPGLNESVTIQAQAIETETDPATGSVSYAVSIPDNIVLKTTQETPSMPIIDDNFTETTESFAADILVPKTPEATEEATASTSQESTGTEESPKNLEASQDSAQVYSSVPCESIAQEEIPQESDQSMQVDESIEVIASSLPVAEESCVSSEAQVEVQSSENDVIEATNSSVHEAEATCESQESESSNNLQPENVVIEQAVEMEVYPADHPETSDVAASTETRDDVERMDDSIAETSQEESPSQSYEQFNTSGVTSDSPEIPTQSVGKSENSREPTQSISYDSMEIDETPVTGEPPTQSFEDTKINEASQSYEATVDVNTNAPTQSFNEIMQCQEDVASGAEAMDDQSFPTQSYEVPVDTLSENLESDAAISQEGNIPSQSNDIGNDGIGTSSVSTNNSGMNEDETASSSYVPETPENQERDQDQESAISTSSYEIPPCEELNIASSSVIPDTSVRGEHSSIHDNGVPEIPTSSYNLNPDSSSTSHVDALPTSSYEDQVIVEQNVSTSYEVPISMPGLEENSSQNFVTESTDHRNEPTSYYARHPEVSASYYETAHQDSNSRLEADPQEEVTPSYYENPQEASQSYFRQTPRYSSQNASPSYYDPAPESEASQSYYSHDIEGTEQSSSRNVEASQSFYQESTDEMRLRQQGEATPTYTERYPVDYALANSPIERHDLVESSVPATRPTER